ncbi:AraC family transcriptional regulator [Paenibacillus pinihumi]|uniref:AraC family transcriptional regulator n=1 Tax=Paenibacillus pinihumi TaxID=669462 RepID=UPI0004047A7E|nr:AraC family transcriptional regulator [Paenibacillus pinihumi]
MQAVSIHSQLHYMESSEWIIGGGEEQTLEASPYERFGICMKSGLHASILKSCQQGKRRGGRILHIAAGEVFFIPAGYAVAVYSGSALNAELVLISFQSSGGQCEEGEPVLSSFRMPQMKNWISEFVACHPGSPATDYYLVQSRLYAIAAACTKPKPRAGMEEAEIAGLVEETRQDILDNYESALGMEELAKSSGAGSSRFYKAFRKITGLSPLKYLINARLNASLGLLADPGVSVAEAAHSVGYHDEYYFSRLFKKHMGLAPTEFASRAQVSLAVLCSVFVGDLAVLGITPRVVFGRDWDLDLDNRKRYLEEISRTRPDYILTGPLPEDLIQDLNAIAPVVVYDWYEYSWQQRLLEFARLLDLESVADRWLTDFRRKTDNARQQVEQLWPDIPYLIVGIREMGPGEYNYRIYGRQIRKFTDLIYDEFHIKVPGEVNDLIHMDVSELQKVMALGSENALFLIEFPAGETFCRQLQQQWKHGLEGGEGKRRSILIHLDEPFLYNSIMHERLIDQIVKYLYSGKQNR